MERSGAEHRAAGLHRRWRAHALHQGAEQAGAVHAGRSRRRGGAAAAGASALRSAAFRRGDTRLRQCASRTRSIRGGWRACGSGSASRFPAGRCSATAPRGCNRSTADSGRSARGSPIWCWRAGPRRCRMPRCCSPAMRPAGSAAWQAPAPPCRGCKGWRRSGPSHLKPSIGLVRGLTDPVVKLNMGQTAEVLAHRFDISREEMDAYASREPSAPRESAGGRAYRGARADDRPQGRAVRPR